MRTRAFGLHPKLMTSRETGFQESSCNLRMVGLGRMGANMVEAAGANGHECVVFDMSPKVVADLAKEKGITGSSSLEDMVASWRSRGQSG